MQPKTFFLFLLALFARLFSYTQTHDLVIKKVNIVDVQSGKIVSDMDVLIHDSLIIKIAHNQTKFPAKTQVVDGSGKYLIPGLWDMHVHMWSRHAVTKYRDKLFFPLLIGNGVTGVREMWDDAKTVAAWRKEVKEGAINGPTIFSSGPIVDGPKPVWDRSLSIKTVADVQRIVDSLHYREHHDFIKVYQNLPRDIYFKLAEVCNKQHFAFEGHVPWRVTILEAAKAGQYSQEHMMGMIELASDSSDYLMDVITDKVKDSSINTWLGYDEFVLRTYNPKKFEQIAKELSQYNSWICPTFTVLRGGAYKDNPVMIDTSYNPYLSKYTVAYWNPNGNYTFDGESKAVFEAEKKIYGLWLSMAAVLQRNGVKLLAGTDFTNPYVYPGFSLHDELELLVKGGLSNIEALQTATVNPATFFKITDRYGSVAKGKVADLVLLNSNPLEDITNTRKINGVVLHGRFLSSIYLQDQLEEVKRLNIQVDKDTTLFIRDLN
ncbi:amidohydrolase family protein [Pinibacter aurantiacus]|uniref:Amidohydrolase family protein n=1 Tax=Pinibacter aurantiacus TaxID=2851599 RepID=A0A9E2SER2_9BACT|nr:amidohydrolase family protein [Pinibacter aurantiacus]MBV4360172.1 amidohydrolase family protein [Pinibacter aurantiacus]